ncbi:MAG: ATP synthase F0 subunit B [Deltaproteobacteria bacterium]|nr:ATP synthase F0 subunit B [Deltaproteobacteria bacterium]
MNWTVIYAWVNFIIFIGLLYYFLRTPLKDFLGDRSEKFRRELESVMAQRRDIEIQFQQIRRSLSGAEAEAARLKKELQEEGEMEKASLIKRANGFSKKIAEDAKRMAAQEIANAKRVVEKEIFQLALQMARKNLTSRINQNDQQCLHQWGVKNLEGFRV